MARIIEEKPVENADMADTLSSDAMEAQKKGGARPRRSSRMRVIVTLVVAGILLIAGGAWGVVSWNEYHHVDPAYTEAIQKIVDEHPDKDLPLPAWMVPGYLPGKVEISDTYIHVEFVSDTQQEEVDLVYTWLPPSGCTSFIDLNVDRLYIMRKKGMEFTYTEKKTIDNIYRKVVYWYDGTSNICSISSDKEQLLSEKDLLHIATSIETFAPKTVSTGGG